MKFSIALCVCVTVAFLPSAALSQHRAPEPRSIAAKCNKEVGGYYNFTKKSWVVPRHLIAAKNTCVQRMSGR
jgi:hypothetical protein